ncbi:MAG TPA: hypothetical protein PKJ17_04505 [Syntrophorhabdaceae bacterium]|nr:hypothetical protein [Syntrophorhabdaceae bacterium]
MKKLILFAIILLILAPVMAMGAGTATYTITQPDQKTAIVAIAVTDDTAGTTLSLTGLEGYFLCSMETNPGTTAPTDDYDIVINTAGGADLLGGAGANRDTANTEIAYPTVDSTSGQKGCVPINSTLSFALSGNSVSSATVAVKLFLMRP